LFDDKKHGHFNQAENEALMQTAAALERRRRNGRDPDITSSGICRGSDLGRP
jgi:hypothetical protein